MKKGPPRSDAPRVLAAPPDADCLHSLTARLDRHGEPIRAAIESMNGARFVHDRLELAGWEVEIAELPANAVVMLAK